MTSEQKAGLAKVNKAIHNHNQKIVKQGNHYKKSTVTPAQYKEQKAGLDKINSVIHDHNQKIIKRGKHHTGSKFTPAQRKQQKAGLEKINKAIHEHNQRFLAKHFPKSSDKPASNSVKRSTKPQGHTPNPTAKPKQIPKMSRIDRRKHQTKTKHRHILRRLFSRWTR